MPLMLAQQQELHYVREICADEKTRKQLMHLGFVKDTPVFVKSAHRGSLIVEVKGTTLALDRKMAGRILVERSLL